MRRWRAAGAEVKQGKVGEPDECHAAGLAMLTVNTPCCTEHVTRLEFRWSADAFSVSSPTAVGCVVRMVKKDYVVVE